MPPTPMAAALADLERIALAESRQSSLFLARAVDAQRSFRAGLKAFACDFVSAPHAHAVRSVLDSCQRSVHGSDLTR
jgi:hypothetical protein